MAIIEKCVTRVLVIKLLVFQIISFCSCSYRETESKISSVDGTTWILKQSNAANMQSGTYTYGFTLYTSRYGFFIRYEFDTRIETPLESSCYDCPNPRRIKDVLWKWVVIKDTLVLHQNKFLIDRLENDTLILSQVDKGKLRLKYIRVW